MKKTLASLLAAAFLMTAPAVAATTAKGSPAPKTAVKSSSMKSSSSSSMKSSSSKPATKPAAKPAAKPMAKATKKPSLLQKTAATAPPMGAAKKTAGKKSPAPKATKKPAPKPTKKP